MATPLRSLLDEALETWTFTRDGVILEVETIPADRFEWRPAPGFRTVAQLVRHIAESALMAAGELTRPDGDFRRVPFQEFVTEYASGVAAVDGKDALLALLRSSHQDVERRFRDAGELAALQYIRRFDGQYGTRLAWLWHAVEHESYHRGQLALMVRLLGKVPALTRMIHGES
ncbi:MAG: DinB family protein [Gemmatimonadetes bacterium]|nr:DinB family protein [Gemmatimonadota bacterium]